MKIQYKRPALYPKQIKYIFSKKRIAIVEASTKAGKSVSCLIWMLEEALFHRPGANHLWVSPSHVQSHIMFRRMWKAAAKFITNKNETRKEIHLINGSILFFRSGDKPDLIYGEDYASAVIDEASRCKDDLWAAVRSTMTATQGRMRLIGNVRGRNNFHYKLARQAEAGNFPYMSYGKMTAIDAIEAGVIPKEEIEMARDVLPKEVFEELYLCMASKDGANPFDFKVIENQVISELSTEPTVVYGCDIAKTTNWCVIIGLDEEGKMTYFDRGRRPWLDTCDILLDLCKDDLLVFDSTGVGDACLEYLNRNWKGMTDPVGYTFGGKSRQQLLESLQGAMRKKQVWYLDNDTKTELDSFSYSYSRTIGIRYEAPEKMNDDCVMSLGLANWGRIIYTDNNFKDIDFNALGYGN